MEKLIEKLKQIANEIGYGEIKVEFTIHNGQITKAIVKEKQEVVLVERV